MNKTERYVIELEEGVFAKWIQWTAGLHPLASEGNLDQALIVTEDWLDYVLVSEDKTRRKMIKQKYPNARFRKTKVTLVELATQ